MNQYNPDEPIREKLQVIFIVVSNTVAASQADWGEPNIFQLPSFGGASEWVNGSCPSLNSYPPPPPFPI